MEGRALHKLRRGVRVDRNGFGVCLNLSSTLRLRISCNRGFHATSDGTICWGRKSWSHVNWRKDRICRDRVLVFF